MTTNKLFACFSRHKGVIEYDFHTTEKLAKVIIGYSRKTSAFQNGQGSHEWEITDIGAGNNFKYNWTNVLNFALVSSFSWALPVLHRCCLVRE